MINFLDVVSPIKPATAALSFIIRMGLTFIIVFIIGLVVLWVIKSLKKN